jgi:hypothetical protein
VIAYQKVEELPDRGREEVRDVTENRTQDESTYWGIG